MTQEEFDALEDDAPPAAAPSRGRALLTSARTALGAQPPARLASVGAAVVLGGALLYLLIPRSYEPTLAYSPDLPTLPAVPTLSGDPVQMAGPAPRSVTPDGRPAVALPLGGAEPVAPVLDDAIDASYGNPVRVAECALTVDAVPLAGALVALDIGAPCDGASRLDVIHDDLRFTVSLDASGVAQITLPALSDPAAIAVEVAGGDRADVTAPVIGLSDHTRAVLQWQGTAGLELHAFEDAAGYGDPGHIGPETPFTVARTLTGTGGHLVRLGEAISAGAAMAWVYTAPAAQPVRLSVEAPVLAENCGRPVEARTIRTMPGTSARTTTLGFTMPGCEDIGHFVMLGDIAPNVALAAN
ncbi:hypothetical protein MWU52_13895 [Jannaschia sp. S6380]|uniref:hypothetical protein n=1 Tax=Jannaschia sp. S6380 TaxID=2926408 RepID=UPI001FF287EA|nr:hypothetical protein [Jannaschia sp. S6380]MCK0168647.1 hypothetical protein [Jannaschia sp. S6380]